MNIQHALALRGDKDSYEYQENIWLLAHVLNCSAGQIRLMLDEQLSEHHQAVYLNGLERLAQGEPLSYITGTQPFWSLDLIVSPETLVPRPDTEILIETVLTLPLPTDCRAVDLGTGTGAIALSCAMERPKWQIIATDIHERTLDIAQQNAVKHQLNHVQFRQGSWFEAIQQEQAFHLIMSNPPYIAEDDPHLTDLSKEPRRALVAAQHGLADLHHIIQTAPRYLHQNGWLVLEHGYDQGEAVRSLLVQYGFLQVRTVQDYAQRDRVSLGIWQGKEDVDAC